MPRQEKCKMIGLGPALHQICIVAVPQPITLQLTLKHPNQPAIFCHTISPTICRTNLCPSTLVAASQKMVEVDPGKRWQEANVAKCCQNCNNLSWGLTSNGHMG